MAERKGGRAGTEMKMKNRILTEMLAAALQGQPWNGEGVSQAAAEQVYQLADSHAVLSMVAERFFACPVLEQRAREVCRRTVLRSYHLLFLTKYVVGVLGERGIETVVLKGVSAAFYYREPELRKSGDVDLQLLDPSRIDEAVEALQQRGFRTNPVQDANHHFAMFSPEGIEIELHTMLVEPFDSAEVNRYLAGLVRELGQHVQEREIMGVCLPVLSEGVQAYQLLLHMLQHFLRAGFGIKLLCDWVVFWNREVDEEECALYRRLIADTGLENFSRMVTSVCVYHLGLQREVNGWLCQRLFSEADEEGFWKGILEAGEFGRGEAERMVVLRERGLKGYLREFHHQMHLNFPRAGRCYLLFPGLWLVTLVRFLRNNRKVRGVSIRQVLRTADRRSRRMELLGLFRTGADKAKADTDRTGAGKDKTDIGAAGKGKIDIEALLKQGKTIQLHPRGWSMYPMFIPGRDEAVIGRADADRLRRGDVVLYRREGSILVLDRILAKKPEGFYMIGDNQMEAEGPLKPEQIRGVLVSFVRKGKKISVKNPCYIAGSRLWMLARPLRGIVRKIRQKCRSTGRSGL